MPDTPPENFTVPDQNKKTTSRFIRGQIVGSPAVELFQGIPYAAPPIGQLRFAAPQPPQAWSGGGQVLGAANDYHGDWLVTRGATPVIVVPFNYRLNIFGFFAHKALSAEIPSLGSGNYTGLDQIQVLLSSR